MFDYFKLNDSNYNGMIVKKDRETREEFYFDTKNKSWKSISIMIRYFWPESDTFEMYESLSEKQVLEETTVESI